MRVAAACSTGCCTLGESRVVVRAAQLSARPGAVRRQGRDRAAAEWAIERMRFALGVDHDLRAVPRALPLRPADRPRRPARPRAARRRPAGAVRGARVGDLRAADRVRARGRDRAAPDGRASAAGATDAGCATRRRGRARAARRRRCSSRSTSRRAARSRWSGRRARSRAGGSICRPRPRARLAAAARDPRDRQLDGREARAHRPGAARPGPGRRPGLPEARRAAAHRRSAGRASEEEVGEFFEPYAPWAGLAGIYALRLGGPAPRRRDVRGLRRVTSGRSSNSTRSPTARLEVRSRAAASHRSRNDRAGGPRSGPLTAWAANGHGSRVSCPGPSAASSNRTSVAPTPSGRPRCARRPVQADRERQ